MPLKDSFHTPRQKDKVYSALVIVGIVSSIMLFSGLSSAVLVRKMDKFWVNIHLPTEFLISTLLILISSIFMIFALRKARKNQKYKLMINLIIALLFSIFFVIFQIKGWKTYYKQGNAVKSFITFVYGQYGQSYMIYKGDQPIEHDGENYQIEGNNISAEELNKVKLFLSQICGKSNSFNGSNFYLHNYNNPYSIYNVQKELFLENKDNGLNLDGVVLSEEKKDELFKFSFGVCNDQPFFMIKGKYGEDFSISLNGLDLKYSKKKLYFPAAELTVEEKSAINQHVYSRGEKYLIKEGRVLLNGVEVDNFDDYFQIKQGVSIHIENNYWERAEEELNTTQYAEFFQTSNISSSFVWIFTVIHFLHLLLSVSAIFIVTYRANKGHYNSNNVAGLKAVGVFWHFVGILWLYLYVFLEYIN